MQNTLAGAGRLEKLNTGTLAIVTSNTGFTGAATIAAGGLTATRIDSLGAAPIAVDADATFGQLGVTGTLQNTLSGAGAHLVTSSTIVIANAAAYTIATTALDAQRPIEVRQDASVTYQYRALVRFGRQWFNSHWHPYGKIAAVSVESDSGEIHSRGRTLDATHDGRRVEFGAGATYRINEISQICLGYEYAKAANYERPWSLNLGYRKFW